MTSICPVSTGRRARAAFEGIENGDAGVAHRVGVVVTIDFAHERLAAVEIELLDLKQLRLDDVDGFRMERGRAAGEIGFADDPGLVRGVDHDEVVRRHRPETDRVGGIRLAGPGPGALVSGGVAGVRRVLFRSDVVHQPLLGENRQHLLHVISAELLGRAERQLERRALHVVDENVQVVGIDERPFR